MTVNPVKIMQAFIGVGDAVFTLYLYKIIYGTFWKRRTENRVLWSMLYLVYVGINFVVAVYANVYGKVLTGFLTCFLLAFLYVNRLSDRILFSTLVFGLYFTVQNITGYLLGFSINKTWKLMRHTNILHSLSETIISSMLFYITARVIRFYKKQGVHMVSTKRIAPVILLPSSLIAFTFLIMEASLSIKSQSAMLGISAILFILAVSYLYVIHVVDKQAELESYQQQLYYIRKHNRMQMDHYQDLYNEQKEIRQMKHDMKNVLCAISGMLDAGETQEAKNYLQTMIGEINATANFPNTSIPSLNTILSVKQSIASKHGIPITYQIQLSALQIDEVDFCVMVANGLDNALEACQKIPEGQERFIDVSIQEKGYYLVVLIKNSCTPNSLQEAAKTSKSDRKNHGFGLENIKNIAQKYEGNVLYNQENSTFSLSIILKNKV